ncbi:hypothetical protein BTA51_00945 [Hahella sp. CCB-MM4]|uniref:hypothetical protein n=1 Tax=Hahella sp. (strain CCB-MM4) TaxID=1926491 RepID=UPI000B9A34E2|nr:hypothetical protein [Hahella sp. CCB-MM4]OZG75001.1 hypothetical protein BTA51_00945 [Hahella sp. CCB-MM4]
MLNTTPLFLILVSCGLISSGLIACSEMETFEYIDNREIPPGPGLFSSGGVFTLDLDGTDRNQQKTSEKER